MTRSQNRLDDQMDALIKKHRIPLLSLGIGVIVIFFGVGLINDSHERKQTAKRNRPAYNPPPAPSAAPTPTPDTKWIEQLKEFDEFCRVFSEVKVANYQPEPQPVPSLFKKTAVSARVSSAIRKAGEVFEKTGCNKFNANLIYGSPDWSPAVGAINLSITREQFASYDWESLRDLSIGPRLIVDGIITNIDPRLEIEPEDIDYYIPPQR